MSNDFARSRWFTRGWTLQELLAPKTTQLYDNNWTFLGTKLSLSGQISAATSIPTIYLENRGRGGIQEASLSMRMFWAANRHTTRDEDTAYCLMGLFGVHMPLLYGEGEQAFIRLQEEIVKHSDDQTIFCWEWPSDRDVKSSAGILAFHPSWFRHGHIYNPTPAVDDKMATDYQLTNSGLRITFPMLDDLFVGLHLAVLNVAAEQADFSQLVCLCLEKVRDGSQTLARSQEFPSPILKISRSWAEGRLSPATVYVLYTRTYVPISPAYDKRVSHSSPSFIFL